MKPVPIASKRALLFAFTAGALVSTYASAQQDWYLKAGSECSGYQPLVDGLATFFKRPLAIIKTTPGELAVLMTPEQIQTAGTGKPFVYEHVDVSSDASQSLRKIFAASSDNRVPFFFKISNAFLLNYAVPANLLNVPLGFIFDEFYSKLDAQPIAIENASKFIAEGGGLDHQIATRRSEHGIFLISQFSYSVAVGKEERSFILSACIYPVSQRISEFQTEGPYNNKKIQPLQANHWGIWDIEGNKWDDGSLRYLYQDPDYYFFESDEIINDRVVGKTIHKISTMGGGWQRKRSDSTEFKLLYAKILVR